MDLLFVVLVFVLWLIVERIVVKRLNIKKQKRKDEQPFVRWFGVFMLIFFNILLLTWSGTDNLAGIAVLVLFLAVLFGVIAWMEWRKNKESKQYVRTIITGSFLVILVGGLLFFSMPKTISYTVPVCLYSEDGAINEVSEMEITGELRGNLLYGKKYDGEIQLFDKRFFVVKYGEKSKEIPIIDRLLGRSSYYLMVEIDSNENGDIWFSRDFETFAGVMKADGTEIRFAAPAQSLKEAKVIFQNITAEK